MQPARLDLWTPGWRAAVFVLAGTSIGCLLAEFFQVCSISRWAAADDSSLLRRRGPA